MLKPLNKRCLTCLKTYFVETGGPDIGHSSPKEFTCLGVDGSTLHELRNDSRLANHCVLTIGLIKHDKGSIVANGIHYTFWSNSHRNKILVQLLDDLPTVGRIINNAEHLLLQVIGVHQSIDSSCSRIVVTINHHQFGLGTRDVLCLFPIVGVILVIVVAGNYHSSPQGIVDEVVLSIGIDTSTIGIKDVVFGHSIDGSGLVRLERVDAKPPFAILIGPVATVNKHAIDNCRHLTI